MNTASKNFRRTSLGTVAALLLLVSSVQAAPVSFDISSATLAPGTGYGSDARSNGQDGENGGTLLGVQFSSVFAAQHFVWSSVVQSFSFDVARVRFYEPDTGRGGNRGIKATEEQNDLALIAAFGLTGPVVATPSLTAIVATAPGGLADEEVDYSIAWNPLELDFGQGGRYRFSLNSLSFTNTNSEQTLRATVELLASPGLRVAAVPEPGSFALVGVALAGAGFVRRKPHAAGHAAAKLPG
jgi:hypothetical protein